MQDKKLSVISNVSANSPATRKFIINGRFMADRMQGIVRYGREILNLLEPLLQKDIHIILAVPCNAKDVPNYKNMEVVTLGNKTGILWEQLEFASFIRKHRDYIPINFCNTVPFFVQPGITAIHDIMYKLFPENYKSIRNRFSRLWHCLQYKYITRHEKKIITVSEFSKREIMKYYNVEESKIVVIPAAWQHVVEYKENFDWKMRYPYLSPMQYFFSLSTLAKNKNFRWIIEVAKRNPKYTFAVVGKLYEEDLNNLPQNVKLLGYVSDMDACSLLKNCKAFLFPSLYEGFGLPPLEALALGVDVISSDTASMPEVLGNSVHYINPFDYEVDLEKLLAEEIDSKEETLKRFSWNRGATLLLQTLLEQE